MRNAVGGWALVSALLCTACGGDEASPAPNAMAGSGGNVAGMTGGTSGASGASGASGGGGMGTDGPAFVMGKCARTGPSPDELEPMLEMIAMSEGAQRALLTTSGLYWATNGQVARLGSDGTSGALVAQATSPNVLAANDSVIAWIGSGTDGTRGLYTAPLGMDGVTPVLVTAFESATALGIDATHMYFAGFGTELTRVPLPSGEPEIIGPTGIIELTVDDGYVYYREQLSSAVKRMAVTGGSPESTSSTASGLIDAMLVDADNVYTSTESSISRVSRNDADDIDALLYIEEPTGDDDNAVWRMIDAGDKIVFVDLLENVGWVSKDGSDCGLIRDSQDTETVSQPRTNVAIDLHRLYIIDMGYMGSMSRIARSMVGL